MSFVGLVVVALALGAIALAVLLQAAQNRASILQRVLPFVEEGHLEAEGLKLHRLRGSFGGRRFEVEVGFRPRVRGPSRYPIRSRLSLDNAPQISLRIRRDAGLAALQKLTGKAVDVEVAGGDGFDRKYLVEAPSDADQAGLAAKEVRTMIHRLIAVWKLDEVRIDGPWVEILGNTTHLDRRLFRDLLDTLQVLAHAYDRSLVATVTPRPVFAWTGGEDSKARCPYCHDTLGSEPSEVGSCAGCGTLIHLECHQELGRCAIIGCEVEGIERQGPINLELPA
jgi:hypothetical protein